jgi:hypothetical protein
MNRTLVRALLIHLGLTAGLAASISGCEGGDPIGPGSGGMKNEGTMGSAGLPGMVGQAATSGGAGAGPDAGVGGQGGAGPSSCVPGQSVACACTTGAQGAQVCQPDGTFAACVCASSEFDRVRSGMVGTWVGPEVALSLPPYQVRITFGADGHYSCHCAQASCLHPVFYYDTDDDSPGKIYKLTNLNSDGTITGQIFLSSSPTTPSLEGSIENLTLSNDETRLHFEFWDTWAGHIGPFVFDLTREM